MSARIKVKWSKDDIKQSRSEVLKTSPGPLAWALSSSKNNLKVSAERFYTAGRLCLTTINLNCARKLWNCNKKLEPFPRYFSLLPPCEQGRVDADVSDSSDECLLLTPGAQAVQAGPGRTSFITASQCSLASPAWLWSGRYFITLQSLHSVNAELLNNWCV